MPTSEPGPLLPDDHPLMAAMTKRDPNAPVPSFFDLTKPAPEVHELEAIPAGLSPEQEIRARALDAAITFVDEAADWDDASEGVAPVLAVAAHFAVWIEGPVDAPEPIDALTSLLLVDIAAYLGLVHRTGGLHDQYGDEGNCVGCKLLARAEAVTA